MPGMRMSIRMMSGCVRASKSNACCPLLALTMLNFNFESIPFTSKMLVGISSTTSTVYFEKSVSAISV